MHGRRLPSPPTIPRTMNNSIHPIEFALAIVLSTIESALWLINELAGFHTTTTTATVTTAPAPVRIAHKAPKPVATITTPTITKRQLQALTGIKSSRYNKADLLRIATEKDLIK